MANAKNTLPDAQISKTPNSTDQIVVFDPSFEETTVTLIWNPENKNETGAGDSTAVSPPEDKTRVAGIEYPIIQINTSLIEREHIVRFELKTIEFKPELTLEILKENYLVGSSPGLVNKITIVLIPPVDGTYKKIKLDFYITNMTEVDKKVIFDTEFLMPAFETIHSKSIRLNGTNKLSTYDLFEHIARQCQLGYATTEDCKTIDDIRPRLMLAQTYESIIEQHIKFAGKDDDSIFTTWVDFYGYLVLCNLSWLLNKSVAFNELAIKQLEGLNVTEASAFPENSAKFGDDTFRILTNQEIKDKKQANIITSYEWEIDNYIVKKHGTNNKYFVFNPISNGGNNNISMLHVKITDDTLDAQLRPGTFNFENNMYVGIELGLETDGNTPILLQEKRRNAFLTKTGKKKLRVIMKEPHLGLQRGTLVNMILYTYDAGAKSKLMQNTSNLTNNIDDELENDEEMLTTEENRTLTQNEQLGVIDMSVSGMYFIDGIKFEYNQTTGLSQTLWLIRKDPDVNYFDFSRPVSAYIPKEMLEKNSK